MYKCECNMTYSYVCCDSFDSASLFFFTGDDDVIDRDEILQILTERGLLFNLRMTAPR